MSLRSRSALAARFARRGAALAVDFARRSSASFWSTAMASAAAASAVSPSAASPSAESTASASRPALALAARHTSSTGTRIVAKHCGRPSRTTSVTLSAKGEGFASRVAA